MTRITQPGIYRMDAETYHADPCPEPSLSASGAKTLLDAAPARYWHERHNPRPSTPAQTVGTAAHLLVLEGKTVDDVCAVIPAGNDARTRKGKEKKAELEATGLPLIKEEDVKTTRDMADALTHHVTARRLLEDGRAELAGFWRDEEHGIWCRMRPDYLPRRLSVVSDYKTCEDASPEALPKTVARYRYDLQAAWYLDGMRALSRAADTFVFIFQEKLAPHLVTCATLDAEALGRGHRTKARARRTFAACRATGAWPGYPDQLHVVGLPTWAIRQEEMYE